MLLHIKDIQDYAVMATDGEMGTVYDWLFDDRDWAIRYLVVETGSWLSSRRVLLAPLVLHEPDTRQRHVPVALTREQVQYSPDVDTDKPVSRQKESDLHAYYGWPRYWVRSDPLFTGLVNAGYTATELRRKEKALRRGNRHLRSARTVLGYQLYTSAGESGTLEDGLFEAPSWTLRFLDGYIRHAGERTPVTIPVARVTKIDWARAAVHIDAPPVDRWDTMTSQKEHSAMREA